MPTYDYACLCGRITESRESMDTVAIRCRCGKRAVRQPVYREQFISCDTGPKGGLKSEPPREEKSYRHEFRRFEEASQEIDYAYSKVDDPKVKRPNFYKRGMARAQAQDARLKIKAKQKVEA